MSTRSRSRPPRGAALLEAMIGLSILLVGMLGLMNLQIYGLAANQGARAHTRAGEVALDLLNALDRLPLLQPTGALNPAFTPTATTTVAAPPPDLGTLLLSDRETISSPPNLHDGTDPANLPPGVIPDPPFGQRDPLNLAAPLYQRRWTVWAYQPPGAIAPVYVVAVSVIYREEKLPGLREVVMWGQKFNQGALILSILSSM